MSSINPLVDSLSDEIYTALALVPTGHCLRVDNLDDDTCARLCSLLAAAVPAHVQVLRLVQGAGADGVSTITAERAIELRNRKSAAICLFVPVGLGGPASSSLENSFARFDIDRALQRVSRRLLDGLDQEVRGLATAAIGAIQGRNAATVEQRARYAASIAAEPTAAVAGRELWQVGLIPDGPEFVDRLDDNRRCTQLISRFVRAHAPIRERLVACHLVIQTPVGLDVLRLLEREEASLASGQWQQSVAEAELLFERWPLAKAAGSNLERIDVQPFVSEAGVLDAKCGLRVPAGERGALPRVSVGAKAKVTVRWVPTPGRPEKLHRWRVEVVPSRAEYGDVPMSSELPVVMTKGTVLRSSVPLDIDLEGLSTPIVQIRVTALDEFDSVLRSEDEFAVEGFSQEFLLDGDQPEEEEEPSVARQTLPSIASGRLQLARSTIEDEIAESSPRWNTDADDEVDYFEVRVNSTDCRIEVPSVLNRLQGLMLAADPGPFEIEVYPGDPLDTDNLRVTELDARALGTKWRALTDSLIQQSGRGTVESADWQDPSLRRAARSFVAEWRRALSEASNASERASLMSTGSLRVRMPGESDVLHALVLLPIHPVRLGWWLHYTEVISAWEADLLSRPGRTAIDFGLINRLAPHNTPPVAVDSAGEPFAFSQALGLGSAIYLRSDEPAPVESTIGVLAALGLSARRSEVTDLPPQRLSSTIDSYLTGHLPPSVLALTALNPGSGTFLASALEQQWSSALSGDEVSEPMAVSITAYDSTAQSPQPIPELQRVQSDLYVQQQRGSHDFLHPLFELAARSPRDLRDSEPPDAHLAVLMDLVQPRLELGALIDGDSSACSGLLARSLTTFSSTDAGLEWRSGFQFPSAAKTGSRADLLGAQQDYLDAVVRVMGGDPATEAVQLATRLGLDDLRMITRMHDRSDWVVTVDRHVGVELFDAPADPYRGRESRRYVLDYAPEFLDGVGHRLAVTTSHRSELEAVLNRAMHELGFATVEESVGNVLDLLKLVSGRLALRVLGDDSHAREAVGLGAVVAHLQRSGALDGAVIVPVDAHPELFGVAARPESVGARLRCDLIIVRLADRSLEIEFVEVKARSTGAGSSDLLDRIADQVLTTEDLIRDTFFDPDASLAQHAVQRTRLTSLLSFYVERSYRNGLLDADQHDALRRRVAKLETAYADFRAVRSGFIVSLLGPAQPDRDHRGVVIKTLNGEALVPAGFMSTHEVDRDSSTPEAPASVETAPPVTEVDADTDGAAINERPGSPTPDDTAPTKDSPTSSVAASDGQPASSVIDEPAPVGDRPVTSAAAHESPESEEQPEGSTDAVEAADEAAPAPTSESTGSISVELGTTDPGGEPVTWSISVKGSPHMFVLGIPGQGKSWAILRLLKAFQAQALPALVFDFHGQFTGEAGRSILRASEGLPFSPFETDGATNRWKSSAWEVAEIFEYVCKLGDMQRDVVYQSLVNCYSRLGFGDGADHRLPTIDEMAEELAAVEDERKVRNVVARCRPLLDFGLFANSAEVDLRQLVAGGLVVDVHDITLEEVQLAAGAFILRKVYKDMIKWGETDELRLAIVLDEAHKLAKDVTLPKLMKEGRKFGIAVIAASQGLQDFHQDVVGNAGTKVVFRTNFPMSKKVAGLLKGRKGSDLSERIEQLGVGEALVQTPEMPIARRVRMHPAE